MLVVLLVVSLVMLVCLMNIHDLFTLTTTDNQVIAVREGAISVVLSVLNKHVSSESVCASACDALKNCTANAGVFDEHPCFV